MVRSEGFTLLEMLVALVILGLSLGALFQSFSGGLRSAGRADDTITATLIAKSRLAALGVETPLRNADYEGEEPGGYRWQGSIRQVMEAGWQIEVTVGKGRPAVNLATFRMGAGDAGE